MASSDYAVTPGDYGKGVYRCTAKNCMCCEFVIPKKEFYSTTTKKLYKIKEILTCKTSNVIYIIQCKMCPAQYVGKTASALVDRFRALKRSITKKEHRPLPDHFNNFHTLEDLHIFSIEHVADTQQLKTRELYWIGELQTLEHGLNLGPCGAAPRKRKHGDNDHGDTKKTRKLKNTSSVYSPETEEAIDICEDALTDTKQVIAQVYQKIKMVTCKEGEDTKFLEALRERIEELQKRTFSEKIYIGLFGKTGAGKSSLMNAIVEEDGLLPSGSMSACTSVLVYVQANTESEKYKAEIDFISEEEWKAELRFSKETNENDAEHMDGDGDENRYTEKVTAVYGEEGLKKSFHQLMAIRDGLEIPESCKTTIETDSAQELSSRISCYIRCNPTKTKQFWPLVKCVTISLPKSPALLKNVVLVDLPGTGDANKHRDVMWKQRIKQCASVWIVSELNRVVAEKEANVIFDTSLKTIGGGGECQNITVICTKTDNINVREFQRNHKIAISVNKDSPSYKTELKRACIRCRNDVAKTLINKSHKNNIERLLLVGVENQRPNSMPSYFNVFTVSSMEYEAIKLGEDSTLNKQETELPVLIEHIKNLFVSHLIREVKDYATEVTGIVSLLHLSELSFDVKIAQFNNDEFIQKKVSNTCTNLEEMLSNVYREIHTNLLNGMEEAIEHRQTNLSKVLEYKKDKRGFHQTLRALCRNDGFYRSKSGETFDLNYTLSEPLYEGINGNFVELFGSSSSLIRKLESFLEHLLSVDNYKRESAEYLLRLLYIKAEQRKIVRNLEKEVLQKKKTIYDSLSNTVQMHMLSTYQECAQITGKGFLRVIGEKLKGKIESSAHEMFQEAFLTFLREFTELKDNIVCELKREMEMSLSQKPANLTGRPDLREELDMMKRHCVALGLRIF